MKMRKKKKQSSTEWFLGKGCCKKGSQAITGTTGLALLAALSLPLGAYRARFRAISKTSQSEILADLKLTPWLSITTPEYHREQNGVRTRARPSISVGAPIRFDSTGTERTRIRR